MGTWTVQDGEQLMVIEVTDGRVSIDIPSGPPFVTGREGVSDVRRKLGLASAEAESGPQDQR